MSLLKAKLPSGEIVFAEQGEELRGKDLRCPYCGAKLIIRHFPERPEYLFAVKEGEVHTSIECQMYQKYGRNAPALINTSPEEFFAALSTPKNTNGGEGGGTGGEGGETGNPVPRMRINPSKAKTLEHLLKSGMLNEGPFDKTYFNESYRNIDYVILGTWAKYIWKDKSPVEIGSRAVEVKWFGAIQDLKPELKFKVEEMANETGEMWFSRSVRIGGNNYYIRFCLDCDDIFLKVKRKFFSNEYNCKDGADDFVIRKVKNKNDQMIVLIGARWVFQAKKKCKRRCPFYGEKCAYCLGEYWAKCICIDQIVLMPADGEEEEWING